MSSQSHIQGRAFEYACLRSFHEAISKIRPCSILENAEYNNAKKAWDKIGFDQQNVLAIASVAAVPTVFSIEPNITEPSEEPLLIYIQPDLKGEEGDVRDLILQRKDIRWEIGFSLKHNNFAVKHSRLSDKLDFGLSWYGIPCSQEYWDDVKPVFEYLRAEKKKNTRFADLTEKDVKIYLPVLEAFKKEIEKQGREHPEISTRLVEYLLGRFDFYKLVGLDSRKLTKLQGFNMHKTLNKKSRMMKPIIDLPTVSLPTRVVHVGIIPGSTTTVELYLDKGWNFTFRIHNASTKVEPSLKFDIQIVSIPNSVVTINCFWV